MGTGRGPRNVLMAAAAPTVVAISMGLNRAQAPWQPGPVFAYAADLARSHRTPRLCVLTTAGPDAEPPAIRTRFEAAFADTRHEVSIFGSFNDPDVGDVASHLAAQDLIWVDRGRGGHSHGPEQANGKDRPT